MKSLFSVISMLVLMGEAQAVTSWEGTRYLLSKTLKSDYYSKVSINGNQGLIITERGSSGMNVNYDQGTQTLKMTMTDDIVTTSYPFYVDPDTGFAGQVLQTSKLIEISMSGHESNPTVIYNFLNCRYLPAQQGASENEVCENQLSDISQRADLTLVNELPDRVLSFRPGDQIVLPFVGYHSIYVRLNSDRTATLLSQPFIDPDFVHNTPDFSNMTWTIEQNMSQLVVRFGSDFTATYNKLNSVEGVHRMIGILTNQKEPNDTSSLVGLTTQADTSLSFNDENAAGRYMVLFGFDQPVAYEFNSDGFGGFDNYFGGIEPIRSEWKWSISSEGQILAEQYRELNDWGAAGVAAGMIIDNAEGIQACISSIEINDPQCVRFVERSHKLLNKTGNRHIVLRTFTSYRLDDSGETQIRFRQTSPMIWYKK
jgi:hypothetical protein